MDTIFYINRDLSIIINQSPIITFLNCAYRDGREREALEESDSPKIMGNFHINSNFFAHQFKVANQ